MSRGPSTHDQSRSRSDCLAQRLAVAVEDHPLPHVLPVARPAALPHALHGVGELAAAVLLRLRVAGNRRGPIDQRVELRGLVLERGRIDLRRRAFVEPEHRAEEQRILRQLIAIVPFVFVAGVVEPDDEPALADVPDVDLLPRPAVRLHEVERPLELDRDDRVLRVGGIERRDRLVDGEREVLAASRLSVALSLRRLIAFPSTSAFRSGRFTHARTVTLPAGIGSRLLFLIATS